MSYGRFTGIGVGPGDPELMTLKAVRMIDEADVLILPSKDKESCRAYNIAIKACPAVGEKECVFEPFPMKMDKEELKAFHKRVAGRICDLLKEGKNTAFLTIGDPSFYSTFGYITGLVAEEGYEVTPVSGVTSFSAVAARLGIPLGEGDEEVHISPAGADIKEALSLKGTKVFMKTGRRAAQMTEILKEYESKTGAKVCAVSNCGLDNEKVAFGADEISDDPGYMTVVVVR